MTHRRTIHTATTVPPLPRRERPAVAPAPRRTHPLRVALAFVALAAVEIIFVMAVADWLLWATG